MKQNQKIKPCRMLNSIARITLLAVFGLIVMATISCKKNIPFKINDKIVPVGVGQSIFTMNYNKKESTLFFNHGSRKAFFMKLLPFQFQSQYASAPILFSSEVDQNSLLTSAGHEQGHTLWHYQTMNEKLTVTSKSIKSYSGFYCKNIKSIGYLCRERQTPDVYLLNEKWQPISRLAHYLPTSDALYIGRGFNKVITASADSRINVFNENGQEHFHVMVRSRPHRLFNAAPLVLFTDVKKHLRFIDLTETDTLKEGKNKSGKYLYSRRWYSAGFLNADITAGLKYQKLFIFTTSDKRLAVLPLPSSSKTQDVFPLNKTAPSPLYKTVRTLAHIPSSIIRIKDVLVVGYFTGVMEWIRIKDFKTLAVLDFNQLKIHWEEGSCQMKQCAPTVIAEILKEKQKI